MEMVKVAVVLGLLFLFVGDVHGEGVGGNSTLGGRNVTLYNGTEGAGEVRAETYKKNELLNVWCSQENRTEVPAELKGYCDEETKRTVFKCLTRIIYEQALRAELGKDFNYAEVDVGKSWVNALPQLENLCRFENKAPAPTNPTTEAPATTTEGTNKPKTDEPQLSNNSSTTTPPPAPHSADKGPADNSEMNHLYWALPLVGVALVLLALLGIYIYRYTKRAGYQASSKVPAGDHVKNEGSDV